MPHVTFVPHTHWDREWYQPFEVFRAHLVGVLDEALDLLERDERLAFTLDGQVQMVDDYLEIRPEAEPRIRALVGAGRLRIGPWLTAVDTLLADGECIIRNLAFGIRRAEALGGVLQVGYMPDQFGHAAQLPQIFGMFGIRAAVLWRGVGPERPPHAFRWVAPDGTQVTTIWMQDGYATGRFLPSSAEGFADAVERLLDRHGAWLGGRPLLVPVGDDHVALASWLPEAVDRLRSRRPDLDLEIGGHLEHLERIGPIEHVVRGELRSPSFAPVLAGVASARIREKQANWRASMLLQRYAEPLESWLRIADGRSRGHLVERAWRQLLLNHGHDSIGGCSTDEVHQDVKARYRWAAQLATLARDHALGSLEVAAPSALHVCSAFNPASWSSDLQVETEVPRSLPSPLLARGPDGEDRPVQELGDVEEAPLFEGELSIDELRGYLGGLDPRAPLFGRFIRGIVAQRESATLVRLDVGLGETPASDRALADDQRRVEQMLVDVERVRVVLHQDGATRRVLIAAGEVPPLSLVPIAILPGRDALARPRVKSLSNGQVGIAAGSVEVIAAENGKVWIRDRDFGGDPVLANDLVDEGDRGDLYHFDATDGEAVRPKRSVTEVIEAGPLRARLRVVQELVVPFSLSPDRRERVRETRTISVTTEIGVRAGQRIVDFVTSLDNQVLDHRLRALVHLPFAAERLDVEHAGAVLARPLDPAALGSGVERPARTGQHHLFVDASDGKRGVALSTRGLPEHELVRMADSHALALTLLRSVGWLARGDLDIVDHAVGPMLPTPDGQELGEHRFEYALLLHSGDWRQGDVLRACRTWQVPPLAFGPAREPRQTRASVPAATPLVDVTPHSVCVTAVHPGRDEGSIVVRVLQTGETCVEARIRLPRPLQSARIVDPCERLVQQEDHDLRIEGPDVLVSLAPWQWKSISVR